MNEVEKLYELWLEKTAGNKEIHDELVSVKGNKKRYLTGSTATLSLAPRACVVFWVRAQTG
jgi:hypothetical protein